MLFKGRGELDKTTGGEERCVRKRKRIKQVIIIKKTIKVLVKNTPSQVKERQEKVSLDAGDGRACLAAWQLLGLF